MGGCTDRQAWASAGLHRCRDLGLPDAEGAVRVAAWSSDRDGGKSTRSSQAGLAGAGLLHTLPPPDGPDRPHPISSQVRRIAAVDRQHWSEGRRRWRVAGGGRTQELEQALRAVTTFARLARVVAKAIAV